jgi:hypothetical protein
MRQTEPIDVAAEMKSRSLPAWLAYRGKTGSRRGIQLLEPKRFQAAIYEPLG